MAAGPSALPGGVLGDVHRGVRHGVDTGDRARGLRAVAWERTAGQLVQVTFAAVVLVVLPSPVRSITRRVPAPSLPRLLALLLAAAMPTRNPGSLLARVRLRVAGDIRNALLSRPVVSECTRSDGVVVDRPMTPAASRGLASWCVPRTGPGAVEP